MAAGHYKQQAIGAILENQPDAQASANFKKVTRQFADAQSLVPVRMPEIPLQKLQGQANFTPDFLGIGPDALTERLA